MATSSRNVLLFSLLLTLSTLTYAEDSISVEISTKDQGQTYPIYVSGYLYPEWDTMLAPRHTCTPPTTIVDSKEVASRSFEITNVGTSDIVIDEFDITSQNNVIMKPGTKVTIPLTLVPGETGSLQIDYNCNEQLILSRNQDGWSYILITLKINNQPIIFDYMKVCTLENRKGHDLSLWLVLLIAILVVSLATRQSKTIIADQNQQMDEIRPIHAVFFITFASISLLTLYFFSEYIKDFLTLIFIFYALTGCSVIFAVWTEKYILPVPFLARNYNTILGPINIHSVLCFIVAAVVVGVWFFTRIWFLNNLIGISIVCLIFKVVRLSSLKVAMALLGLAFLYDIFWVFISKPVFGESVMLVAANSVDLPIKIEWPYIKHTPLPHCSFLGLGDMILPGFFVAFNYRFSQYRKRSSYFLSSILAYAAGLLLCGAFLILMDMGQPALLYVVPLMLGTALCLSLINGELKDMWEGIPENFQYMDISTDTIPSRIQLSDTSLMA